MHVRTLDPSDALAYRALMLHGYESAADAFTSTTAERAAEPLDWWHKRICDPKGLSRAFGAFVDGALVGSVAIEFSAKSKTRHKALVVGMYVAEAHRHLGAGRALLQAAIAHARSRVGVKALVLTVTEGNAGALRLYQSAGFRQFGLEPMAIFTGIEYKAKAHLVLLLGPDEHAVT